jgi:hypothetical protein
MLWIRNRLLLCFLIVLTFSFSTRAQTGGAFHGCAIEGDATQTTRSDPDLNLLKNRTEVPDEFRAIHFDDLAQLDIPPGISKKHRAKWPQEALEASQAEEARAVQVSGVLLKVKLEGPESPNCHLDGQGDRDFHLWLANSADDDRSEAIVVEITPRIRAKHASWSRTNLSRLISNKAKVRVSGWILLDPEHAEQLGKTRTTLWEIHPIMRIEVFTAEKWREL